MLRWIGIRKWNFLLFRPVLLFLVFGEEIFRPNYGPNEEEDAKNSNHKKWNILAHVRLLSIQIPKVSNTNAKATVATDQ